MYGYILRDRRSKILAANVPWPQQQSERNARSSNVSIFDFEDDIVDASSNHFFFLNFFWGVRKHDSGFRGNFGVKLPFSCQINVVYFVFCQEFSAFAAKGVR